ncbi:MULTISPECIES: hypothetical protein [Borreliella]|uniref:Uncharacterized protein n=1 Tax=Borreliella carolinensis TaxID=478174 RepID=A0ACD5GLS8_9SPIR|nr:MULTISPECIES: hypothetical protein [Borreliella]MCD2373675.1 hypothetical protein [Borreliella burgdorferi]MCD2381946.1 hypothetical protein [Borreliella americana]MCD2393470.1 hypothetical protein [Borreliella burgdorferi]MCD2401673.1 hypothetical protein [Borreliella bissettiae]
MEIGEKIRKSIFDNAKSFVGFKIRQKSDSLKSHIPGRLSNVTNIDLEETSLGISLKVKVGSPLSEFLDSGQAYNNNLPAPSLTKIKSWAAYKGIESSAVPIWLSLKKRKPKNQYTNWTSDLVKESAKLLR